MILIGQYDSPFVRRVAVALTLYDFAFEHRPWSVWADADRLAAINPMRRVPTLVLDDGEVLIESSAILDALDEMAGPQRAMLPRSGPERRRGLKVCALATGLGDKAVSLFYEGLLHAAPSQAWIDRCRAQIGDVLTALDVRPRSGDPISRSGLARRSATPTSPPPAPCASPARRTRACSTPPTGRYSRPTASSVRRCRRSRPSASR